MLTSATKESAVAAEDSELNRLDSLKLSIRPLVTACGLIVSSAALVAQETPYRSAAAAPAAWQNFAKELQGRFQERLSADDERTHRLQEFMARNENASLVSVVVHAWVSQNGKVERIHADGIDDAEVEANLRALLTVTSVSAPPPDMPQPLHLRLALRARDQQDH